MCKNLIKIKHEQEQETQTEDTAENAYKIEIEHMQTTLKSLNRENQDYKRQIERHNQKFAE